MKMLKSRTGQSILEYVIVLTVIIAAILAVAKMGIGQGVEKAIGNSGQAINNASAKILNVVQ